MSVKEKQATIAHFSAVEDDLEKFFEINLNFIYCSGIAVSKQIKKCIDSKLSPGTYETQSRPNKPTALCELQ